LRQRIRPGCGQVQGVGLTPLPATAVRPPLIAECPVNIECRVLDVQAIGDHDLFLGEAVAQHVDEALLDAEGKIAVERLGGFAFVLGEFWTLGRRSPGNRRGIEN